MSLGGMEVLVILAVALLVLGPDKLPNVVRTVGKALGELRRVSTEFQRAIHTEAARSDDAVTTTRSPEEKTPARDQASAAPDTPLPDTPGSGNPAPAHAAIRRSLLRAPRRAHSRSGNDAERA